MIFGVTVSFVHLEANIVFSGLKYSGSAKLLDPRHCAMNEKAPEARLECDGN
jgi:hypothetical protein